MVVVKIEIEFLQLKHCTSFVLWQTTSIQLIDPGADPGGVDWVANHPPLLRSFKLEIKKMNKTITEATLSPIVLILF